ncbi:hypothetical protein HZY62_04830 [Maribacter polysiphoniae]|uniref:Uncharacterized protein n=1 Tax=Maribacter polysiphoniae TaxID=429344 RepID=A0A316E3U4_9FLAO|nr:hypothetical protein [Maribacter polysiphoniae]MBD1259902.1 hypothetical protein [Maribacter polysiphoniae]PWK25357.1 hypothetical protein LX92_00096 [Maribacter polysiphoniae]
MENSIKNHQNKYFFSQVLLRKLVFLLPVVFLLFGCEKDTNDSLSDNSISFSKNFNAASFKNVIPYGFDVDWQNPLEVITDTIPTPFYEFSVTNSNLDITEIQMRHKERNISIQYKVIAIPSEDVSYDYYMVKFTSFSPYGGKVSFNDLTGFSGRISFYDTDGSSLSKSIYDGGMLIQSIFEKGTNKASFIGKEDVLECTWETIPVFTDWYYVRGIDDLELAYTTVKYESKWVCGSSGGTAPESGGNSQGFINDGTHGGGSGGNSSSGYPEFNDEVIGEDHIDNYLTGKAKCVYDKLETTNGNLFKKTIAKFIDDPEYNLTFQNGDCSRPGADGCTNSDDVNNMVITIENINQSSLGIAALILHEGIHAEIHRYVSRYRSGVDPNNRAQLLQYYAYYKGYSETINNPAYRWLDDAHHVYMIENYIKSIALAVREIDGNKYPLNYYMAYGWDGLRDAGYDIARLTDSQDTSYKNLKEVVENNFNETCN